MDVPIRAAGWRPWSHGMPGIARSSSELAATHPVTGGGGPDRQSG